MQLCQTKNLNKKLDLIHNAGLRIATKSFHTNLIKRILIEAGEPYNTEENY